MELKDLIKEIEELRHRMHELAENEGGVTPRVYEISSKIDNLVVQYMLLEGKMKNKLVT